MRSGGKVLDFEEADPDTDVFGLGKIEDFTWKGLLDMGTCTECGRCQSQCPAWATGKPLSPQAGHPRPARPRLRQGPLAPRVQGGTGETPRRGQGRGGRPLVGTKEQNGVIDPEVIWSCTNCGACVEECPVDIEHIDHIDGMRRHQVLVESAFPQEATTMLNNLERRGNPWGMAEDKRLDWITELDFEVPVIDGKIRPTASSTCSGSAAPARWKTGPRRPPRPSPSCCTPPGSAFAVLGPAETCTGDPARRLGNEFVFSMLAQQNVETLNEAGAKKVIASCPHCFNTIAREYPQLGGNYEVIHHTQLLATLVEEGRLTPVSKVEEKITYHDPCFLGRHNKVYTPPREIIDAVPGTTAEEMHRCKNRGFCCGAGGARMWLEERTGKRINTERIDEALALDPDTVSTACPYCLVMLGDAVNAKKAAGEAKPEPRGHRRRPAARPVGTGRQPRPFGRIRREKARDTACTRGRSPHARRPQPGAALSTAEAGRRPDRRRTPP